MNKLKTIIKSSPFIITLIYIVVGVLWIQYSDQAVFAMFDDAGTITQVQSYKGWFYVLSSGVLIFFLVYQSNFLINTLFADTQKEKNKFEATFEYAPLGIAHHKPNEKWILVNQTLCKILGYKRDELLQLNFEDFIHSDDIDKGRQLDQDIIDGVISSYKMEKKYRRKDGSYFIGKVTKGAVYDENEDAQYLIAILEDVTQQKEDEAKLKMALEEKEVLLAEVHHRVKNNIALMSALLELQLMYSKSKKLNNVLQHYKTRLKSLSLVYENFSGFEKEPNIDFKWYLNEQIIFLNHIFHTDEKGVRYQTDLSDIRLNINQAIPVGLICNEILIHANARQFADIQNPFINIQLTCEKELVTFTVENNGERKNELIDLNNPESLDARIMNALVEQIEGNVTFREDGDRETYELVFKKGIWKGSASYNQPKVKS